MEQPEPPEPPEPSEIRDWLEWAGSQMLSLSVPRIRPSSYRSFWPEIPPDPIVAYGFNPTRLRPPPPGSEAIKIMDGIFDLILLVPHIQTRRILQARALVSPLNGRYLYGWTTLAVILHSNRKAIAAEHKKGLRLISSQIPTVSLARFRRYFS